ncbi:unnamed protein product [Musa acuminata subsp. burmannicoides]
MLPQRAPSPLECIDHGAHRDERLRQRLPQDCRGVPPRPAAAARSLGNRFLSEVPPVCICRLCTCSHLFGGSDGFSHRRHRLRRLLGLKANSHVFFPTNWSKVYNVYGKFCRHIGSSITISLVASILLVLLVVPSAYSLHRRCH